MAPRFAQFFICPLISSDGVEREIKAVDSEHGKNLNADAWRQHQLCKHTANQDHPYTKFFTGAGAPSAQPPLSPCRLKLIRPTLKTHDIINPSINPPPKKTCRQPGDAHDRRHRRRH
jgi:hypothetical protein